jgi:1,2-dihydroxy-3-keto-5-methylthiopentene dioxygenase
MALLRTDDGRTFVGIDAINEVIAPTKVDAVGVPAGLDALLGQPSLTPEETKVLLDHRDPGLEAHRVRAGWPEPLAQVFFPGMPPALEEMLASFAPPHTNPVDEIHHVVDGAVVFGLVLGGGAQALVIVQPGDALHLHAGTEHWSTLTTDRCSKTVLYLSRPPGYAHAYTGTEIHVS